MRRSTYGQPNMKEYYLYQMEKIISEYEHKYTFVMEKENTAFCYIGTKEIHVPYLYKEHPCSKYLFDIYHEIGHLETNTLDMERYMEEYTATIWAIKACGKRKIYVSPQTIMVYQDYIRGFRDKSPNRSKISDKDIALPLTLYPNTDRIIDVPTDAVMEIPTGRVNKKPVVSANTDIISYLRSQNVEFVDRRLKGGNLTIVGTEETIGELVNTICSEYGIAGRYSGSLKAIKNRAGWWTKG